MGVSTLNLILDLSGTVTLIYSKMKGTANGDLIWQGTAPIQL